MMCLVFTVWVLSQTEIWAVTPFDSFTQSPDHYLLNTLLTLYPLEAMRSGTVCSSSTFFIPMVILKRRTIYQYSKMNWTKSPQGSCSRMWEPSPKPNFVFVIPGHQYFISLADTLQKVLHKILLIRGGCTEICVHWNCCRLPVSDD